MKPINANGRTGGVARHGVNQVPSNDGDFGAAVGIPVATSSSTVLLAAVTQGRMLLR